jgi:hypothetical protein
MAFRLRQQAEEWFKYIFKQDGPIQRKFDVYYFCLMLGLATSKLEKPEDAPEIVDYFITEYKPVQRIIIGLLLIAELHRMGTDLSDRKSLQKLMDEYLDPTNPANLTDAGFSRLNDYAAGGFTFLAEQLEDKPHRVEDFLQLYVRILDRVVPSSETWKAYMVPGLNTI